LLFSLIETVMHHIAHRWALQTPEIPQLECFEVLIDSHGSEAITYGETNWYAEYSSTVAMIDNLTYQSR